MDSLLQYLLQSSVIMAVFYVIYFLFLRNERLFKEIRLFLIVSLVLSLVLPLIKIPYTIIVDSIEGNIVQTGMLLPGSPMGEAESVGFDLTRQHILFGVYVLVASVLLVLSLIKIFQVYRLLKGKESQPLDGNRLVLMDEQIPAFTFFGYIVINREEFHDESLQNILAHEKVHAQQKHWIDLLLLEVLSILFWFNPFVWLFQLALKQVHELLADDGVIARGFNIGEYQALLINQLMGAEVVGLANNFNYSINKKRMIMMLKAESPQSRRYKLLLMLPVVVAVLLFNLKITQKVNAQENIAEGIEIQEVASDVNIRGMVLASDGKPLPGAAVVIAGTKVGTVTDINGEFTLVAPEKANLNISFIGHASKRMAVEDFVLNGKKGENGYFLKIKLREEATGMKVSAVTTEGEKVELKAEYVEIGEKPTPEKSYTNKNGEEVFVVVEKMPEFPGGDLELRKFLARRIKYPVEAEEKGIRGRVFVTFEINKIGDLENVRVVKGVHPSLDKEAIRLIKAMPQWKPGYQRGKAVRVSYTMPFNFGMVDSKSKFNEVVVVSSKMNPEMAAPKKAKNSDVFVIVEKMPEFPGGEKALAEYLEEKVKALSSKYHIDKKCFVAYIVNEKGKVTKARVIKGTGNVDVDAMAVNIVNEMPEWKPGMQRGKNVKVSYTLPIHFK